MKQLKECRLGVREKGFDVILTVYSQRAEAQPVGVLGSETLRKRSGRWTLLGSTG